MYATYTPDAIITVANTEDAAIAEVERLAGIPIDQLHDVNVAPITARLAVSIAAGGTGVQWSELPCGTLCTLLEVIDEMAGI